MAEIALVNANTIKPAIGPLGLEYIAEACRRPQAVAPRRHSTARRAGVEVEVIDLCFEEEPGAALKRRLAETGPELVGITLRNSDNCFLASSHSFIPELGQMVAVAREATEAPILLGGAGFAIAPGAIMNEVGAEYGILGDGEQAVQLLLRALRGATDVRDVPGLLWREGDEVRGSPPAWPEISEQPGLQRDTVDNRAYFEHGGQIGLETKRGCDRHCIYCADPVGKGRRVRLRSPRAVADEIQSLLGQGIDVYHLCDSEFNLSEEHAEAVCEEVIRRGLGGKIRWYGYLSPRPFSKELADLMRRAGCGGINFGVDSGSDEMLARLGRDFSRADILEAARLCREREITVMLDLLIGAPGETQQTASETIAMAKDADASCAGISLGVRIYAGTSMASLVAAEGAMADNPALWGEAADNEDLLRPVFYLSPALGTREEAADFLSEVIAGDARFFFGGSGDEDDYDYDDNPALVAAIADGARGAYWDILRQMRASQAGA